MKILITGAAGMLGSALQDALNDKFSVLGVGHSPKNNTFNYRLVELTDQSALRDVFADFKPDYVFHCAAFTKVDLCESERVRAKTQNTDVVESLVESCNAHDAMLFFFSTDYVFAGDKVGEYVESDPVCPMSYYGQTKVWAEEILFKRSERFMIFRITWLFGSNGPHFPGAILKQAKEKQEISVVADQWGRPTWAKDLAEALVHLLTIRKDAIDRYNKNIFHLGNDGKINWSGYAREILDDAGCHDVHIREITSRELNRPAKRPLNSVLSLDKAQALLGIRMRPWTEALHDFMKEELAGGKSKS